MQPYARRGRVYLRGGEEARSLEATHPRCDTVLQFGLFVPGKHDSLRDPTCDAIIELEL